MAKAPVSLTKFSDTSLIHLLVLSLVLVVLSALTLESVQNSEPVLQTAPEVQAATSATPVLTQDIGFPVFTAQAVYAADVDTGTPLYQKNTDAPLLPASTTKIMTALVAMDNFTDSDIVTIGNIKIDGQKMGLYEGEQLTAGNLLQALLVYSANDAAEALAQGSPGGRLNFIQQMNVKAARLGLTNALFVNPSGLDGENQLITASDMYKLALYALNQPRFAQIVRQSDIEFTSVDGRFGYKLHTTNQLLGQVPGVLGVKTGYTDQARENLVTYVERDGKKVLLVVMGSQDRFGETKQLIDWIFANYTWKVGN